MSLEIAMSDWTVHGLPAGLAAGCAFYLSQVPAWTTVDSINGRSVTFPVAPTILLEVSEQGKPPPMVKYSDEELATQCLHRQIGQLPIGGMLLLTTEIAGVSRLINCPCSS
jgi:hypothetical protein